MHILKRCTNSGKGKGKTRSKTTTTKTKITQKNKEKRHALNQVAQASKTSKQPWYTAAATVYFFTAKMH